MAKIKIDVQRVGNKSKNASGEFLDEFSALSVPWQQPGFVYCYLADHPKMMISAKRRGWAICDVRRDFIDLGCPEHLANQMPVQPDGSIRMGDAILGKLPASRWDLLAKERKRRRDEKAGSHRNRAELEAARIENRMRKLGIRVPEGGILAPEARWA